MGNSWTFIDEIFLARKKLWFLYKFLAIIGCDNRRKNRPFVLSCNIHVVLLYRSFVMRKCILCISDHADSSYIFVVENM